MAFAGPGMIPASFASVPVPLDRQRLLARLVDRLPAIQPEADGVVSLTVALPPLPISSSPLHLPDIWSWTRPSDGLALIGLGTALQREFPGPAELATALRRLVWHHQNSDDGNGQPVAFLGHGFGGDDPSGLPGGLLRIPRLLLRHQPDGSEMIFSHAGNGDPDTIRQSWLDAADRLLLALQTPIPSLSENVLVRISENPQADVFKRRVRAVTSAIAAGRVEKVVLSRRVVVAGSRPFIPARLAAALIEQHPTCAIFTAAFGSRILVAASPERLVACQDRRVESYALAGTARCDSDDPFLGGRLLCSAKDRHEHRLVVGWIEEALSGLCETLDVPAEPRRMALGKLQHLWTPISGVLRPGATLLEAATRLHPTPAVAGLPLAAARALLDELGETRSGWYTGAMGWIDRSGDGELAVVLRCALLNGYLAELSAGGGIVAASQAEAEFAETELKLQTMLDALLVA
ncbi:isochorismate synthase [Telmatospirillum sp.]|uniref:isochorismate synthase n=1 Tax=Telmatospirillum sp. TaxID=2079197 RepID=UPI00284D0BBF|nr:isochorismate synthase [Telmatospirillum sp.]MDR3439487.1 isochorismate synthase [Telmatospirillum sp.]